MKTSYQIALITYSVTLSLYLISLLGYLFSGFGERNDSVGLTYIALVFGLLTQFVLGVVHIILTIYVYVSYGKLTEQLRLLLNTYSALVVLCIGGLLFAANSDLFLDDFWAIGSLITFPMVVGAYFVVFMNRLYKKGKFVKQEPSSDLIQD